MSRSHKKPILKDKANVALYWRTIRHRIKQQVNKLIKEDPDEVRISEPKELINDYNYCDWKLDYRDPYFKGKKNFEKEIIKAKRK